MNIILKIAFCYLFISMAAALIFSLSSCNKDEITPTLVSADTGSIALEIASPTYHLHRGGYVGPPARHSRFQTTTSEYDIPRKCPTPENINISHITPNSALVTWSAVPGAIGYNIEYEKVIPTTAIAIAQTSDSAFVITGLKAETTYQCRLQAMCSYGYSNYSPWQIFKTGKFAGAPLEKVFAPDQK